MPRTVTTGLVAALAALLPACATAPKLEPPKVSVAGLQIVSGELWVQHLKLRLHVHNPNDRDLPVKGLEYTVEVAGQALGSGSSAESFVVPAHGDAEFDTSVTTNLAGALMKLLQHPSGALVPYRLAGKISLAEGLGRIPFEEQASFSP